MLKILLEMPSNWIKILILAVRTVAIFIKVWFRKFSQYKQIYFTNNYFVLES